MMLRPTLVIGASPNPERFSYIATRKLAARNYPVFAVGLREGEIDGVKIQRPFPVIFGIHTVTLYVSAANQPIYYDYILYMRPRRVIFNPGTENEEFERILEEKGIEVVLGCTIVMLNTGMY
jgi:predicted CoA-binding protein